MSAAVDQVSIQAAAGEAGVAYQSIVKRLADGNDDPQLRDVQAALAAAGKSTDDLRRDVAAQQLPAAENENLDAMTEV